VLFCILLLLINQRVNLNEADATENCLNLKQIKDTLGKAEVDAICPNSMKFISYMKIDSCSVFIVAYAVDDVYGLAKCYQTKIDSTLFKDYKRVDESQWFEVELN